jgi:hypothetical protein
MSAALIVLLCAIALMAGYRAGGTLLGEDPGAAYRQGHDEGVAAGSKEAEQRAYRRGLAAGRRKGSGTTEGRGQ